ncbi:MAG TPA: 5-deoxy-glucuronate isomerase [Candidatus Limnocylindria bacterium]
MIHPAAPPNDLPPDQLRLAPGEPVSPDRAGWRYLSFALRDLQAGDSEVIGGEGVETLVITLAGGLQVGALTLEGRASVFDGGAWAAYLPPGHSSTIGTEGGATVAVASAPAFARERVATEPMRITPADLRVETRGAGNATRQINHIVAPDFPADRLLAVEVYTPSGNWSSWPPHKHDADAMPDEAVLEEVYCYQFRRPEAWGVQRLYRRDGSRDALWSVRHGEVVLVTDGYHPFVATQGDDAYYLNVLAGDRRTMACSFDPDLDFVRESWGRMAPDPRVPLVPPLGS